MAIEFKCVDMTYSFQKKAQSILAKIGLGEFRGAKMNPKLEISRKRPRKRKIKIKRLKSAEVMKPC